MGERRRSLRERERVGTDKRVGDRFARENSMKGERKKSRKGPLCEK